MRKLLSSLVNKHSNAANNGSSSLASCQHQRSFPWFVDDVMHDVILAYQVGRKGDAFRIWTVMHPYGSGVDDETGRLYLVNGS